MQRSLFSRVADYATDGMMLQIGFEPKSVGRGGAVAWEGFSLQLNKGGSVGRFPQMVGASAGWEGLSMGQRAWSVAPGVLGLGFTAYSVYQGGRDGGLKGAYDALVWDLAANAGAARWAFGSKHHYSMLEAGQRGIKLAGTQLKSPGLLGFGARYTGAGIGASIGQSLAGTPGAFIGGYLGAAPFSAMMRHPVGVGALAVTAATATVGYGAYQVVKQVAKAGYAHGRSRHGLDTSGSMASFMTQGAMTMRARAVSAMHKSHLNARSALGQEANFMHYPSRNYHSRYRF